MSTPLKLLLLEDNPSDAELMLAELRRAGFDPAWKRVDNEGDFKAAIDPALELILADYGLPQFTGFQALEWVKRTGLEIPFILVSGTIGEELAVEAIKRGAADYLLKDRLARLGPAVANAVEQQRLRNAKKEADEALIASARRLHALLENSADGITLLDAQGHVLWDRPAARGMLGYSPEEWIGKDAFQLVHPDDMPMVGEVLKSLVEGHGARIARTFRVRRQNGSWLWVEAVASNFLAEPGVHAIIVNYRDVNKRKQAEAEREVLLEIMKGVASTESLNDFLELVRRSLSRILAAENLFVVLHHEDTGLFEEVFAVDKYDAPMPPSKLEKSITSYVFRTGIPLLLTADGFENLLRRGEVEAVGAKPAAWLGAPLQTPQATIGVIAVQDYDRPDAYTEHDRDFLASVGTQVALAIQRKGAEDGLQQRARELQMLYETSQEVAAETSLDRLLVSIVERAAALLGTDSGALYLTEPDGQSVRLVVGHNLPRTYIDTRLKLGEGMSGTVAQSGKPMQVEDYQAWPARSKDWDGVALRRVLALPLKAKDELIGVINVADSRQPGSFSEDQIRLGSLFANQAAVVIQRRRAEDALRESHANLRTAEEIAHLGSWSRNIASGEMTGSDEGYRILGLKPQSIRLTSSNLPDYIHPEDRRAVAEAMQAAVAGGQPYELEYRILRPDGTVRWVLSKGDITYSDTREPLQLMGSILDITERKQAEEKLAASEAELRALFAAMSDVVVVYDREGRYLQIAPTNPANLYLPTQAMLGKRVHDIFSPELADFFVRHIGEVLMTGQASQCEYSLPIQGQELWFAASAAPLSENSVVWVAHDITNRKQADTALKQQLRRLASLHSIDEATRGFVDIGLILQVVLDHTMAQLGADAADFLLLNPVTQTLDYAKAAGFRTQALQHTRLPLGQGYAGRAALERQLVHVSELRGRATDFLRSPLFGQEDFISYYGVPLVAKGVLKGVLEVFHRRPFEADAAWTDFLESLAGHAAVAIDSVSQFEDAQRSNMQLVIAYDATIEGWSRALDLRDKETEGHTQRVTALTLDLAHSLGVPASDMVHIRRGALLHDIGKMGVPDAILLKPGSLTDEEWVAMKKHPRFAYDMLSPIQYLHAALDIPYCHHEKWDGSGYPRGLKGDEIPLAARIFAVIDVWDALTSDRPYRQAWTHEKALEHIRSSAGSHFDPSIVEIFLQAIRSGSLSK